MADFSVLKLGVGMIHPTKKDRLQMKAVGALVTL
jgi:hypothetical protein